MTYLLLAVAVITEVTATMLLKMSNGWEKWAFGYGAIFFYAISGMLFAMVLKNMGIGVAYAIWSGVGVAAITAISVLAFDQKMDVAGYLGIILIVAGVVVLRLFSESSIE